MQKLDNSRHLSLQPINLFTITPCAEWIFGIPVQVFEFSTGLANDYAKQAVLCRDLITNGLVLFDGPGTRALLEMVELLYKRGYADECFEHRQFVGEKKCSACVGKGVWRSSWNDATDTCRRCYGSGIVAAATTVTLISFWFDVGGSTYCWHQPKGLVPFNYLVTGESQVWQPGHLVAGEFWPGKTATRIKGPL